MGKIYGRLSSNVYRDANPDHDQMRGGKEQRTRTENQGRVVSEEKRERKESEKPTVIRSARTKKA